jgi:hypothetical protein
MSRPVYGGICCRARRSTLQLKAPRRERDWKPKGNDTTENLARDQFFLGQQAGLHG